MSDSNKRKTSQFKQEWRKTLNNPAQKKYTREEILQKFKQSETPNLPNEEGLSIILEEQGHQPALNPSEPFSHPLTPFINSRRPPPKKERKEQLPEWYAEDETEATNAIKEMIKPSQTPKPSKKPEEPTAKTQPKKPVKVTIQTQGKVKNLPEALQNLSLEEEFSKIDEKVEQKIKAQTQEDDETMPEWEDPNPEEEVPLRALPMVRYPLNLLLMHLSQGNPFAAVILDHSKADETGAACPIPYSKPFEKVWYYKDPQGQTQGPFSSIEMFNWSAAGYFMPDLQIAHSNTTYFAPLMLYMRKTKETREAEGPPANDENATNMLKSMLGLGAPAWTNTQNTTTNLEEIQKQQARSKRF